MKAFLKRVEYDILSTLIIPQQVKILDILY